MRETSSYCTERRKGKTYVTETQLCDCRAGSSGIVTKIEGESHSLARLQELGLLAGQWVKIIRAGNPIIFDIADSRYCIRAHQLQGVSVHVVPDTPSN